MHAVEFKNVTFVYERSKILDNISFCIEKGDFVSIIGRNGSGKSMLARHVNGLLLPTSGDVFVNGMNTKDKSKIYDIRQKVGLTFQNPDNQIVAGTVEEDAAFGLSNLGIPRDLMRKKINDALESLGISQYKTSDVDNLSGGTKQKLILAGALAMGAECLVLDEPTSMLDPESCRVVMDELIRLNQLGITIILLTHHMNEAKLARKIFVLDSGKLVAKGTKDTIDEKYLQDADFSSMFFNEEKSKKCVLEFKNVSFKYDGADKYIINKLNFKIHENEVMNITGPTGTGKSTIAKLTKGMISPDSGEIFFDGEKANRKILNEKVGIVFQFPENQLFEDTVIKDVMFGPRNLGFSEKLCIEKSLWALELIGFNKDKINCSPFSLSGGEQRLVAIAGIIAMEHKVIVLDEPTAGLDVPTCNRFFKAINKLRMNRSIMIISHSHQTGTI